MKLLRQLCWWNPRCVNCGWREPLLTNRLCFDCSVQLSKARMWKGIADAVVELAPLFIKAFTDSSVPKVRHFSRRNPSVRPKSIHSDELRELRKIAGLPELPTVERPNPTEGQNPGEAKA